MKLFDFLCILLYIFQYLDVATTVWILSLGYIEGNKMMLEIMYFNFWIVIFIKIFVVAFLILMSNKFYHLTKKNSFKIFDIILYSVLNYFYLFVVINNFLAPFS